MAKTVRISELRKLAELQCSETEMAKYFGISLHAFKKLRKTDEMVSLALETAEAEGKISLRRNQFNLSKHSASMAIHLGKQWLGQTDKSQVEVSGPEGGPIEQRNYDFSGLSPDEKRDLRKTLAKTVRGTPA